MMTPRRTKDEISRIPQDDDPDGDPLPERVRYFWGRLALRPGYAKLAAAVMVAVSLSGHLVRSIGWWPDSDTLDYAVITFRFLLIGLAMYLYTKTLRHTEREFETKLARTSRAEEHTQEEAVRYRNTFYRWRFLLSIALTIFAVGMFALIGTKLVFPWGGFLLFMGVMLGLVAAVFVAYLVLLFHEEIISNLRWWAYCLWRGRRAPRQGDKDGRR